MLKMGKNCLSIWELVHCATYQSENKREDVARDAIGGITTVTSKANKMKRPAAIDLPARVILLPQHTENTHMQMLRTFAESRIFRHSSAYIKRVGTRTAFDCFVEIPQSHLVESNSFARFIVFEVTD